MTHPIRPRARTFLLTALALLLALGAAPSAHATTGSTNVLNAPWWVRTTLNVKTKNNRVGLAYPEDMTYVFCYRDTSSDNGRVHLNGQGSSRWFLIWFQSVDPNRREQPGIGFVSTLAIDRAKQPRVPRCVGRPGWPERIGPPGDEIPPGEIIYGDPGMDDGTGGGDTAPAPGGGQPTQPVPVATYPETAGGVAHTWTNPANAGGSEGPSVPGHATVQIACKLNGFRVADGNTWWYRIAQSPWNGQYYVSADAFYNNGATSGSLRGTPFVDPAVRDC